MSPVFWIAVAIGAIIFLAPDFYSNKFQLSLESELVKLSPEYEGTNKLYFRLALAWVFFSLTVVSILLVIPDKNSRVELIMSAVLVLIFSTASLLRGVFALVKGVFPSTKYYGSKTLYAYSDNGEIKRFGQLVMVISSSIIVFVIMLILIMMLV